MKLYDYWRSSSSWRVRLALAHKGIVYTPAPVNLLAGDQAHSDHRARNPLAQVPVLELDDGTLLAQSLPIIEYLEEIAPRRPLLPTDPLARARVRQIAEMVNAGIQPLQNLRVLETLAAAGADREAWAARWIGDGLAAVERVVAPLAGRYTVGNQITMADLFIVPQLYNARRFDVDLASLPTLTQVESACAELPAFLAAHPERQPDATTQ